MQKRNLYFSITLLIIIFFCLITLNLDIDSQRVENIKRVCIKKYCFEVEISDNSLKREKGLMDYNFLPQKSGMLFIFENEKEHNFWMKNMSISLDIIWINEQKEIVYIAHNVLPCKESDCPLIRPNKKAKYVLEINKGLSKEFFFNIGDRVEFK
jgi:uncharacterized protein